VDDRAQAVQAALARPGYGTPAWSLRRFQELTAGLTAGEKLDVFLDLDEPCQQFIWEDAQRDKAIGAAK
jgi:hypothetical protein